MKIFTTILYLFPTVFGLGLFIYCLIKYFKEKKNDKK